MQLSTPQDFGAVGDGVTDDAIALQNWANSLRDGGLGAGNSVAGYATSATITFMPSTNTGPVKGPDILGNLKIIGHASLPAGSDLLRVWNPTAVTTSQNFYSPTFNSLELCRTTGAGVSFRGFWGSVKKIIGTHVRDVVIFPNFIFAGIPDIYESMCDIGDVTGIDYTGVVYRNLIGIGASVTMHNVRGTEATLSLNHGLVNASGSEKITGCMAYSGRDWAVVIDKPPVPGIQATPHEIFMEGNGDIDVAEYGWYIANLEASTITGHRMNIEPPNFGGLTIPSWPIVAYSFGAGNGVIKDVTVNAYLTIRPGVTAANIGVLFRFNNAPNITNLILNVWMSDQTGIWAGMPFTSKYNGINTSATMKIIENGVTVYSH